MYKLISFLLAVCIFSASQSYAMDPNERKDRIKLRLQKKLGEKDKDLDELNGALKHMGMCLDTLKKEKALAAQIKDSCVNNFSVIDTKYLDMIPKVIKNTQITEKQATEIKSAFSLQNLNIKKLWL